MYKHNEKDPVVSKNHCAVAVPECNDTDVRLVHGLRVYVCKPCFVKLEEGCKTIPAVQQIVTTSVELCPCGLFL